MVVFAELDVALAVGSEDHKSSAAVGYLVDSAYKHVVILLVEVGVEQVAIDCGTCGPAGSDSGFWRSRPGFPHLCRIERLRATGKSLSARSGGVVVVVVPQVRVGLHRFVAQAGFGENLGCVPRLVSRRRVVLPQEQWQNF